MRGPGLEEEIWVALALPHSLVLGHNAAHWALPGPPGPGSGPSSLIGDCPQTSPLGGTKS